MKHKFVTRTRIFSFTVPACMDGMIALAQTALPLVAIRFGATPWFLGMLGWVAQGVRLPCTIGSGLLSEKIGRTRLIIPAAILGVLACAGFAVARNNTQLLICYAVMAAGVGLFYPALQAFIGDHSPKGELRKNLSFFNAGWTVGASVCGLATALLFAAARFLPFAAASLMAFITIPLVLVWSRTKVTPGSAVVEESALTPAADGPGPLLFIARTGHFLGFFGFTMWRLQFPKLATDMHMPEQTIAVLTAMLLVGQASGILVSSVGPWWRGKLWPQMLAQGMLVGAGLIVFVVRSPLLFGLAFLIQGTGLGIAYTGALYYGLQARTNMGRNTGLHEALVTSGNILGSITGGLTAQFISLRAPYVTYSALCLLAILVSLVWWTMNSGTRVGGRSSC
jgi:MFS family permease